jgi:hypothetical protein
MSITYQEYREEVRRLAEDAIEEASKYEEEDRLEHDVYDFIYETVDGHQWVIYYAYNDDVIRHTSNPDSWEECYNAEDIGDLVIDQGMTGARCTQAFWALYQDVTDEVHDQVEKLGLEE